MGVVAVRVYVGRVSNPKNALRNSQLKIFNEQYDRNLVTKAKKHFIYYQKCANLAENRLSSSLQKHLTGFTDELVEL